jgi:uncharacterized protein
VPLDVEALVAQLQLSVHPEGGWYRELFISPRTVVRADGSKRASSSLIWFLLGTGDRSVWHRIAGSEEIWYFVDGGPLELTWVEPHGAANRVILGARGSGFASSAVVQADSWQTARPLDEATLVQCGVSPGFDFADFSMLRDQPGDRDRLIAAHPTLVMPESLG